MDKIKPQEKAQKPNPKYTLDILKEFPDLVGWLKQISRYQKFEDFIYISDYKKGEIRLKIFTKEHYYSLSARIPTKEKNGYLGCISSVRKARAGEDWLRGNDLADGDYSEKTWQEIKDDIIAYELVKVVRTSPKEDER